MWSSIFFLACFFFGCCLLFVGFCFLFLFMKSVLSLDPEGSNFFRCEKTLPVWMHAGPAKVQVFVPRGFWSPKFVTKSDG